MFLYYRLKNYLWDKFVNWLTYESPNYQTPLTSFERLRYELRPGDVVLVEGRSNVAEIIKAITQSMWTHSVFYIGRLHDIDDPMLRDRIQQYRHCSPDEQLIIEAILGKGIIVSSIEEYEGEHLRICRPRGITRSDSQAVIKHAVLQLGTDYNVRQIMDLFRFMFPYWFLPRRWRSTLFEHKAGRATKTVCSTMMAEAFASVRFPIVPVIHQNKDGKLSLIRRNSKLITPRDFDSSPYFDVIKYPILDFDELGIYRKLPWDQTSVHYNTIGNCFASDSDEIEKLTPIQSSNTIHYNGLNESTDNVIPDVEHKENTVSEDRISEDKEIQKKVL
ncbi:MAG: YiiX/YebB-like N1pC/P60 family cysteine hydrolase [Gammaproteobacteria bacterium]